MFHAVAPVALVNGVPLGVGEPGFQTRKVRHRVTRERFETLVEEALGRIPVKFRRQMRNLAIVVEDAPTSALLREMGLGREDSLLGLYQGVPLPSRSADYGNALPDRITLFQRSIEEASADDSEAVAQIAETLIHEIGHYFGLSEREIEAIEERYWKRIRAR